MTTDECARAGQRIQEYFLLSQAVVCPIPDIWTRSSRPKDKLDEPSESKAGLFYPHCPKAGNGRQLPLALRCSHLSKEHLYSPFPILPLDAQQSGSIEGQQSSVLRANCFLFRGLAVLYILNGRILLANLLQGSSDAFPCASFPSFFAFKAGMWETHIAALLSSPTVSGRLYRQFR